LSRSIELGVLIAFNVAKISVSHPMNRNLDYNPGDIVVVAIDNHLMSHVVRVIKLNPYLTLT
jgi:predicted P-loop ATPase/GTPase